MGWLTRIASALRTKTSDVGSWTVRTAPWNFWQVTGAPVSTDAGSYGPVYACWAIISQEISRIPLKHVAVDANGTATTITNRAPARVLRRPNAYQTRSDFLMYLARSCLAEGNGYARAVRNDRYEIAAFHPIHPRACWPHISEETGEVFYRVSDSYTASLSQAANQNWVPARDMLHVRMFTPAHPLIGETPLVAAALSVQAGLSINAQTAAFFQNMARPSGIIRHPKRLEKDVIQRIKERFMEASNGVNAGAPMVFTEGMEWSPLTMSAVDAELIASAKLTQNQIAQIYRVPPFMLGDMENAKFASVESLTRWFINSGLGFHLDHISDSFTRIFDLPMNEEIEFDYEAALLRSDFKEFMTALEVSTRSGVMSPNEARRLRRLPPVKDGDEPRVQQQLVPLSYGAALQPPSPTPEPTPPPEPKPEPEDDEEDAAEDEEEARAVRVELMRRRMVRMAA